MPPPNDSAGILPGDASSGILLRHVNLGKGFRVPSGQARIAVLGGSPKADDPNLGDNGGLG